MQSLKTINSQPANTELLKRGWFDNIGVKLEPFFIGAGTYPNHRIAQPGSGRQGGPGICARALGLREEVSHKRAEEA